MNIQIQVPNEFRTDVYQGMYRQKTVGQKFPLLPLLEHVLAELFKTKIAPVRAQTLTLINVWAVDARLSVGYSGVPSEATIPPNSGIVVTYSLRSNFVRNLPEPERMAGLRWWKTWGTKQEAEQYITIGIPRTMLVGSEYNGLMFLNAFYNAMGVVSRNLMLNFNVPRLEPRPVNFDIHTLKTMYETKSMRSSFRSVPYDNWQYIKQVWTSYSDMLIPKMFYGDFPAYYIQYLKDFVYVPDLNPEITKYVETTVEQYVAAGLAEISTSLYNCVPPTSIRAKSVLSVILQLTGNTETRTTKIKAWYDNLKRIKEVGSIYSTILGLVASSQKKVAHELVFGNETAITRDMLRYMRLLGTSPHKQGDLE